MKQFRHVEQHANEAETVSVFYFTMCDRLYGVVSMQLLVKRQNRHSRCPK